MFLSARARAVRRCCWKKFVLIALSYLPADKCFWVAFNNRHISFEWKKRCCFYFSVSCPNNLLSPLVNRQTYWSAAHERDKISWRVWTILISAIKIAEKKIKTLSQKKKTEIQFVINNFRHCVGERIFFLMAIKDRRS